MSEAELIEAWRPMALRMASDYELRIGRFVPRDDLAQCGLVRLLQVSRRKEKYSPKMAIKHGILDAIRDEFGWRKNANSASGFVGHGLGCALAAGMTRCGMDEAEETMPDPWTPRAIDSRLDLAKLALSSRINSRALHVALRRAAGEENEEIAESLGISGGRVSQINKAALLRLKEAALTA